MELRHLLLTSYSGKRPRWQRYTIDAVLATLSALAITAIIYVWKLYPNIPNISLLYVPLVMMLASTRGRFAAIVNSVVAFLAFDYFLVSPFYTLAIAKFNEWLALVIFLITAVITGQLASALRARAEQASQRERETRALYQLVSATTNEESLERQLGLVAKAIVESFVADGVRDCTIFLPGPGKSVRLLASASVAREPMGLEPDEEKLAQRVIEQQEIINVRRKRSATGSSEADEIGGKRATSLHLHGRMFPLKVGQRAVGVVRITIVQNIHEEETRSFVIDQAGNSTPRNAFFFSFLDQAASIIEHARLHQESMQVEVLQRTDELRAALLSSVSHDLRTPLSSIKAAASSLLQEDVQWDEEARRSFATSIEREADRLNRLVGNLLDMSRIEGGALQPEKEWYPIEELIHDVVSNVQARSNDHPITVTTADGLPPVQLDYLQMDQVLTNLLENAIRYTPVGTPIEVRACVQDNLMLLSIADRGPGIPHGDEERIFDKFYSVADGKRKKRQGFGLGLAVCRGLVEAHGGRIWAENRKDGGAIFFFTLPLDTEVSEYE